MKTFNQNEVHGGIFVSLTQNWDLGIANVGDTQRLVLQKGGEYIDLGEPTLRALGAMGYAADALKAHAVDYPRT